MKGATQRIRRLFTPVEQRATLPPPAQLVTFQSADGQLLRLRQLCAGERRRFLRRAIPLLTSGGGWFSKADGPSVR